MNNGWPSDIPVYNCWLASNQKLEKIEDNYSQEKACEEKQTWIRNVFHVIHGIT
jgi:hypothetical protein